MVGVDRADGRVEKCPINEIDRLYRRTSGKQIRSRYLSEKPVLLRLGNLCGNESTIQYLPRVYSHRIILARVL